MTDETVPQQPEPTPPPVTDVAAQAPEETAEQKKTRLAREALYGFLCQVADAFQDRLHTAVLLPTELLTRAANAPVFAGDLSGPIKDEIASAVIGAIKTQLGGKPVPTVRSLVSRARADTQWVQTAFFRQPDKKDDLIKVYIKLGDELGQPIAIDHDGVHLTQYPYARFVWVRDFAWSYTVPAELPFRPDRKTVASEELEKLYRLDPEKGKYVMDELVQAIDEYDRANAKMDAEHKALDLAGAVRSDSPAWNQLVQTRAAADRDLRDTIKLAAIRVPALDRVHRDIKAKRGLKDIYAESDLRGLANASAEHLRMLLNDDAIKVDLATSDLQPSPPESIEGTAQAMLDALAIVAPVDGVPSVEQLLQAREIISRAAIVFTGVAQAIRGVGDGADQLLTAIASTRAVLAAIVAPPKPQVTEPVTEAPTTPIVAPEATEPAPVALETTPVVEETK